MQRLCLGCYISLHFQDLQKNYRWSWIMKITENNHNTIGPELLLRSPMDLGYLFCRGVLHPRAGWRCQFWTIETIQFVVLYKFIFSYPNKFIKLQVNLRIGSFWSFGFQFKNKALEISALWPWSKSLELPAVKIAENFSTYFKKQWKLQRSFKSAEISYAF